MFPVLHKNKAKSRHALFFIFFICLATVSSSQNRSKRFKVLVLYENKGHHLAFTNRAVPWLKKLGADSNFYAEFITDTKNITGNYLSRFDLFIQLDYVPYGGSNASSKAFEEAITNGSINWLGLHHATLIGEFDGYQTWDWFSTFMGGIRYKNYIADFAAATVRVEDHAHPVMNNISDSFFISKEEWYIYDKSPRQNVHVLASVNEHSYSPDTQVKMGDHPVIWSNQKMKGRNIYVFMGHSPDLFDNSAYCTLLKNAIFWAAGK
jgi:type 1 glutamine amidotransferase